MSTRTPQAPPAPAPRIHDCGGLQSLRFGTEAGGRWSCESHTGPTLVIATRGRVEVSAAMIGRCSVRKGSMTLVPEGSAFRLQAFGITRVLICRLYTDSSALQPCFTKAGELQAVPCSEDIRTVADLTEVCLRTDMPERKPDYLDRQRQWLEELLHRQCCPEQSAGDPSFKDLDDLLEFERRINQTHNVAQPSELTLENIRKISDTCLHT